MLACVTPSVMMFASRRATRVVDPGTAAVRLLSYGELCSFAHRSRRCLAEGEILRFVAATPGAAGGRLTCRGMPVRDV